MNCSIKNHMHVQKISLLVNSECKEEDYVWHPLPSLSLSIYLYFLIWLLMRVKLRKVEWRWWSRKDKKWWDNKGFAGSLTLGKPPPLFFPFVFLLLSPFFGCVRVLAVSISWALEASTSLQPQCPIKGRNHNIAFLNVANLGCHVEPR